MRTFAPLTDGDLPVSGDLLDALVDHLGAPGRWVVSGATARDLALTLGGVTLPRRATNDVNIAIVAHDALDFDTTLSAPFGQPTRAWQRRYLLGQQADVVPFGGLERDGPSSSTTSASPCSLRRGCRPRRPRHAPIGQAPASRSPRTRRRTEAHRVRQPPLGPIEGRRRPAHGAARCWVDSPRRPCW